MAEPNTEDGDGREDARSGAWSGSSGERSGHVGEGLRRESPGVGQSLQTGAGRPAFRPQRPDESLRPVMSDRVDGAQRPVKAHGGRGQEGRAQGGRAQRGRGLGGRYDSHGDEAIAIEAHLLLREPFRLTKALVKRLEAREVELREAFTIRDGSGGYFRASLEELNADGGVAVPYERMERSPEPAIDITLACAVLARQRMIFVMQKATELGVRRVIPLLTDHSVPAEGLNHERANSWPAQVIRAAKQCRRSSLPQVLPPTTLDSFARTEEFQAADVRVLLDDQSAPEAVPESRPHRVVLIVGPEGGFSNGERLKLAGNTRPWILGGRVLRAETAVMVGLTAVQMMWGDFAR